MQAAIWMVAVDERVGYQHDTVLGAEHQRRVAERLAVLALELRDQALRARAPVYGTGSIRLHSY